jgi:STE24 endopeptidase
MRKTTLRWLYILQCSGLLIVIQPNTWWLWMAALLSLETICESYLAPIYFYSRIYKITPIEDEQLVQALGELTMNSKTKIRQFFKIERKARNQGSSKELYANGYFVGWGRTSSIILTDGLINNLTHAEIKATLAHELGHSVYHDIGKKCLLNFFLTSGEFLIYGILYHWIQALFFAAIDPKTSYTAFFSILMSLLVYMAFFITSCVFQINRKYSRYTEYWADEFALHLTGDALAFKNAMIRMMNLDDIPLTLPPYLVRVRSHPTILSRLQHADEFATRKAGSIRQKS